MSSVFRPKRRVNGKVRVARIYVGQFRLAGDVKATRVALGVIDKEVAKGKLRRIVREAEREREGLIPTKEQRDVSTAVPIKDHGRVLLAAGEQTFSLSESASVGESPEVADGARCRIRTCDFLRVKQALYH
jgi:hypothetical protein